MNYWCDFDETTLVHINVPQRKISDYQLNGRLVLPVLRHASSHSSLHSLHSLPPASPPIRSIRVAANETCPIPICRLGNHSHEHVNLVPQPRFDFTLPETQLNRFNPNRNPFPQSIDVWCLEYNLHVQMQDGLKVYDKLFGEVTLIRTRVKGCPTGWRIFAMVDVVGTTKAYVAVKEEWCARESLVRRLVDMAASIMGK